MLARKILVLLTVLALSTPAFPQGGTCKHVLFWGLSGYAGNTTTGAGGDPNWQQQLQNLENQFGGSPTCTYTPIHDSPQYTHFYGDCRVYGYVCTAAPPLPPPNSAAETSPGQTCPANAPTPFCGHPINLTSGNTYIEQSDIKLPGLGGGLNLTRTWNSVWPSSQVLMVAGLFGNNWKSTYDERVFQGSDGTIKYARSSGEFWSFQFYGPTSSTFVYQVIAPANVHATMTVNSKIWTLTFHNGEQRTFDATTGLLTAIIDRNGITTQLTYDSSNRLVTVSDAAFRHLTFSYSSPSSLLVTGISSDVGLSWSYSYDSANRLTKVTKPDQTTINFTYNAQSLITAVTDSQGKILESHTYDGQARGLTSSQANGVDVVTVSYPQ